MQCAQSNDKSGYAGFRSEEVTEGVKMKARIAVHSRTNAPPAACGDQGSYATEADRSASAPT